MKKRHLSKVLRNLPPNSGEIAISHNSNDRNNIVKLNMEVKTNDVQEFLFTGLRIPDNYAECVMKNGIKLVMAVTYVSPSQKTIDLKEFIYAALFEYNKDAFGVLASRTKIFINYDHISRE